MKVLDVLAFQADEAGDAVNIYEVDAGVPGRAIGEQGGVVAAYAALDRDAGDGMHGIGQQSAEHRSGQILIAGERREEVDQQTLRGQQVALDLRDVPGRSGFPQTRAR